MSAPPMAQANIHSPTPSPDLRHTKKAYRPPRLVEWGTLSDLTQGPINGTVDGFFSGSGGT